MMRYFLVACAFASIPVEKVAFASFDDGADSAGTSVAARMEHGQGMMRKTHASSTRLTVEGILNDWHATIAKLGPFSVQVERRVYDSDSVLSDGPSVPASIVRGELRWINHQEGVLSYSLDKWEDTRSVRKWRAPAQGLRDASAAGHEWRLRQGRLTLTNCVTGRTVWTKDARPADIVTLDLLPWKFVSADSEVLRHEFDFEIRRKPESQNVAVLSANTVLRADWPVVALGVYFDVARQLPSGIVLNLNEGHLVVYSFYNFRSLPTTVAPAAEFGQRPPAPSSDAECVKWKRGFLAGIWPRRTRPGRPIPRRMRRIDGCSPGR